MLSLSEEIEVSSPSGVPVSDGAICPLGRFAQGAILAFIASTQFGEQLRLLPRAKWSRVLFVELSPCVWTRAFVVYS